MKVQQKKWSASAGWQIIKKEAFDAGNCNLVIVFGSTTLLSNKDFYNEIRCDYPNAVILINSTAGEIIDTQVNDETISLTAIQLEKTIV
ncbi:MAG: FIST N-terminal domain-containing protein, partial [Ginsengibacter sp.]